MRDVPNGTIDGIRAKGSSLLMRPARKPSVKLERRLLDWLR